MRTRGFTLIEVAIALAVAGLMLGAAVTVWQTVQAQKKIRVTRERMDMIVSALSVYVESAARLPCPSDPASPQAPTGAQAVLGWERGVAYNQTTVTSGLPTGRCALTPGTLAEAEGIVPFNTLGLPFEAALDGWGRYFTYAVSPVFTQDTDESGTAAGVDTGFVHALCRTPRWISNDDNANGPKAKFCCALGAGAAPFTPATDIAMFLTTDTSAPLLDARATANYGDVNQRHVTGPAPGSLPLALRGEIDTVAVVLISHGENGAGAYLVNGTNNRTPFTVPLANNLRERDNENNDRDYFTGPVQRGRGPGYFDDIVLWLTQDGLMAYNGTSSCTLP